MAFGDVYKQKEKQKRKLAPVTAAEIKRVLTTQEDPGDKFRRDNLWLSGIYYNTATQFVLDYWDPKPWNQTWTSMLHTTIGNVVHEYVQEKLHAAGVLFPQYDTPKYKEIRIFDPLYRFSGRLDGLLAKDFMKALGATTPKELPEDPGELLHLEIKTMGSDKFQQTKTASDLMPGYKSQASITQKIIDKEGTLFLLIDKGSLNMRTLWYPGEEMYWNAATALSTTVFQAIENETLPLEDGQTEEQLLGMSFKDWLAEKRENKPVWENWNG